MLVFCTNIIEFKNKKKTNNESSLSEHTTLSVSKRILNKKSIIIKFKKILVTNICLCE